MEKKTSFRSFDLVRVKKKRPIETKHKSLPQKRSQKNWGWVWFLLLVPILIGVSLYSLNHVAAKFKFIKMFQNGRYLVLFQNNAELRPSGGFIGSFAEIEFSNFKIKKIDFNSNIYKMDKAYTADHIILPPYPLTQITDRWALRDANMAVSFPESAQKIAWFYREESGQSVDGVIAINASVLRDLLRIIGPITLSDPSVTISADNFFTELTNQIEDEYFNSVQNQQTNEPKEILKTMMPQVIKKSTSLNKINLFQFIITKIKEKDIQFYNNNVGIEQSILDLNYGGKINDSNKDYLHVNVDNIGGSKSSQNIKEGIDYKVGEADGLTIGDLTITRTHIGTGEWPDGVNNSYIKVLVPKGSVIKSAKLDETDITAKVESGEEAGKTYLAAWVSVKPQENAVLRLKYSLPITLENYELLMQKQSGNNGDLVKVFLNEKLLFNGFLNKDIIVK